MNKKKRKKPINNKESLSSSPLPLTRVIPNIITLLALCFGLSSIYLAIHQDWTRATIFIVIAGFLDGVDGRLARFLGSASSKIGVQLDSLADFCNFGIAPPIVIYLWKGQYTGIRGLGWAMVLFYASCMALRLARFNVITLNFRVIHNSIKDHFFSGVPAPCGAGLMILPLILSFDFGEDYFFTHPVFVVIFGVGIALLLVSTIPTFSIKKLKIKSEFVPIILVIGSVFVIGMVLEPWLTLSVISLGYLLSIPVSIIFFIRMTNISKK